MSRPTKFDTPEKVEFLDQAIKYVEEGAFSLRKAAAWLSYHINDTITYEGLRKIMIKRSK